MFSSSTAVMYIGNSKCLAWFDFKVKRCKSKTGELFAAKFAKSQRVKSCTFAIPTVHGREFVPQLTTEPRSVQELPGEVYEIRIR